MSTPTAGGRQPTRKRRYQHVLSCVSHNTGFPDDPQPATIAPPKVALHLAAHGAYSVAGVKQSIRAAQTNGDLVAFEIGGERRLARRSESGLKKTVAEQNCSDDPDVALIEQCSKLLGGLSQ